MSSKKPKSSAVLTIRNAEAMDDDRRQDIAEWLKWQAEMIVIDGKNYSKKFTARFVDKEEEE